MITNAHPFLDFNRVHDMYPERIEPAQPTAIAKAFRSMKRIPKSALLGAASFTVAVGGVVSGVFTYDMITPNVPAVATAQAATMTQVALTQPKNMGNEIPENFPGIHSNERRVYYYRAAFPGQATVEQIDGNGCEWDVLTDPSALGARYPAVGEDGLQKCTNMSAALQPVMARMIGDTLPNVAGSAIRIVNIIDPRTGKSMLQPMTPATEEVEGDVTAPQTATASAAVTPRAAPSKNTPAPAPVQSYQPRPRPERVVPYEAPPGDRMVPMNQPGFYYNPNDPAVPANGNPYMQQPQQQSSISGKTTPTPLRGIKPGERPGSNQAGQSENQGNVPLAPSALPGLRPSESPNGSPLGSISGN